MQQPRTYAHQIVRHDNWRDIRCSCGATFADMVAFGKHVVDAAVSRHLPQTREGRQ